MRGLIRLEKRIDFPVWFPFFAVFISLVTGLVFSAIIFALKGVNPLIVLGGIFSGSFGSLYGLKETLGKAIPLMLIGTGLTLPFMAKFWNIGAEGQLVVGAAASAGFALFVGQSLPAYILFPLMFLCAFIAGAIWAVIPVVLKNSFGVSEVISTLMLNYIAFELVTMLVVGPWRGATQQGYPYSDDLPEAARLYLFPYTRISPLMLFIALIIVVTAWFALYRSRLGYEIRVTGESRDAARYAGIHTSLVLLFSMAFSGGLAGVAGLGEITAIHHHLAMPSVISAGYGFTGIIVAWLARRNPLLVPLTAFFFAGILVGGDAIQISVGLPASTVSVFNGIILLSLLIADFILTYRLVPVKKTKTEKEK
ncbi:ABC transporter permease [Spirochaetia bacterium 38H-sp]|uniref:ABC transporter permease n=1 Tax=Rarispira pelagica TaxID=3141764 RepID=A0ABU9UAZ5_9SPIR